jgi:hypothetical protein
VGYYCGGHRGQVYIHYGFFLLTLNNFAMTFLVLLRD